MRDFQFHRPGSVEEAIAAMTAASDGKFLAGGQSLLPVMKLELAAPSDVVSLSGIEGLDGVSREGDSVVIGAMATHGAVAESPVVREAIPALADLAEGIGDPQVRNRGTLGGAVAHNDPAADYPAALVGLGATVLTDRREIAADDFFGHMFDTTLEADEVITAVRFPVPAAACYAKFPNPASRYAIVGVFVARTGDGVRVAVTGAATGVFRASEVEQALAGTFAPEAITTTGVDAADLMADLDASAEYRAHLVGVMARRAVAGCG
jgi:carbon-monoxide dehydrogenase medium subunit